MFSNFLDEVYMCELFHTMSEKSRKCIQEFASQHGMARARVGARAGGLADDQEVVDGCYKRLTKDQQEDVKKFFKALGGCSYRKQVLNLLEV